jgi:predicted nucleic acid-binding protein
VQGGAGDCTGLAHTNVASFLYGDKPEAGLYRAACRHHLIFLSFQTVLEMLTGAEIKGWGEKRRAKLEEFLNLYEHVYPDEHTVRTCARLTASLRRKGKTLSIADTWIAATALASDLVLIAHDGAFRHVPDLRLICHVDPDTPPSRRGERVTS